MARLVVIGGGVGASALISLLKGDPSLELVGVLEKKADSPGAVLARKWDIPVFDNIQSLRDIQPDLFINVTGDPKIREELRAVLGESTEFIDGAGTRLLWEVIEKQKKASVEALKIIEDQKTFLALIAELEKGISLQAFLERVLEDALSSVEAPAGSIVIREKDNVTVASTRGLSKQFTESISWGIIPGGLTAFLLENKELIEVNDTQKSDFTKNNSTLMREKIRSVLACPILFRDDVKGIIFLDDFKPRRFSEKQKAFISILAALAGIAFSKFFTKGEIEQIRHEYLSVLEIIHDLVLITDSDGKIEFFNERSGTVLGYSEQYMKGKPVQSFIGDTGWEAIRRELEKSPVITDLQVRVNAFGGTEMSMFLNAAVLKGPDDNTQRIVCTLQDRTGALEVQKSLEDKIKEIEELQKNFDHKVLERTKELEKINRDLEYANQVKGKFIANMSHELRTPLNSILGFSEVLLDKTFGALTDNQERYLKNINSSGKHLLELINNVLDLAKIEAGKYEMFYETFPVEEIIHEVIQIMNTLAESKFIEMSVSIDHNVSMITADRVKLKQILYNLLSNAIKFTPEGGMVKVSVMQEISNGEPYTPPFSDLKFIRFSVQDTGIGISPEDKEKIFDEFGQANSGFSKKHVGVGLGLSLTKKLVELHGGMISLESTLGEGSTFSFLVPVTSPTEIVTPEPMEAVSLNFPWAKEEAPLILVVEDDLPTAELLTLHLTQAGYKVAHAFNGTEALDKARDLQPFAITLDVLLPKKDGWEVLQEIKSDPKISEIPVIIHSIVDNKELAFALGAVDYLLKPLDKEALLAKLEEITVSKGKKVLPVSVLIIESEDEMTNYFKEIFEPHGFLIYTAATAKRGIELASALRPAVILLDFTLPDMLSFDLIKEIKEQPATKEIPIFILTERDLSVEDRMGLVGKIERIVQKYAFDTHELIGHIKELELLYPRRAGLVDDLTGVFSHRYFQIRLAQEVERATRYKLPLNLLLLDLDFFDDYVKKHGDYYGNMTLKKVAELLRKNIRGSDIVVRYGGDSFAIILPNTVVSAALSMSNRFNAIVKNYPFIYEDSLPKGHITASIGLTFLDGQTTEEFLLCAEKALTQALDKGGDRVEVYAKEKDEKEKVKKH